MSGATILDFPQPAHMPDMSNGFNSFSSNSSFDYSGRSTPVHSQSRAGSMDYSASFGGYEDLTPPGSANVPYFPMPTTTAGMSAGYLSSSAFPQPPATPERSASFSSGSDGSTSPPDMMGPSYPPSVASMSSMTSMATLSSGGSPPTDGGYYGPATPGYPFPETMPAKGLAGQMALPAPFATRGCEVSPSDFYWNRAESPVGNYFGDRPSLPPPPPSATLKSSVVKSENVTDAYLSPTSESPYDNCSSSPSRRHMHYMSAQSNARALQNAVGNNYGSIPANPAANDGTIVTRNGIQVSKIASGAYKCIVPGCPSRPFKRSEHLKRHVTT